MKTKTLAIVIIITTLMSSCGPKRYKCGPYRRCNIEIQPIFDATTNSLFC